MIDSPVLISYGFPQPGFTPPDPSRQKKHRQFPRDLELMKWFPAEPLFFF